MTRATSLRAYLLSGVSYAIPFVACGGILIAVAIAFAPMAPERARLLGVALPEDAAWTSAATAFSLLVPVLAGYIAFGMADRPGLVPGFVGGAIANQIGAGFLGGMVAGLLAGFVVMLIKKSARAGLLQAGHAHPGHPGRSRRWSSASSCSGSSACRSSDLMDRDVGLAAGDGHRQPRAAGGACSAP